MSKLAIALLDWRLFFVNLVNTHFCTTQWIQRQRMHTTFHLQTELYWRYKGEDSGSRAWLHSQKGGGFPFATHLEAVNIQNLYKHENVLGQRYFIVQKCKWRNQRQHTYTRVYQAWTPHNILQSTSASFVDPWHQAVTVALLLLLKNTHNSLE